MSWGIGTTHIHPPYYPVDSSRSPLRITRLLALSEVELAARDIVVHPTFRAAQRKAGSWATLATNFESQAWAYELDGNSLAHLIRTLDAIGALD